MTLGRPLEQLHALVTGGGSGIGLACARSLLADGAVVTIAGRSEERLVAAADDLAAGFPDGEIRTRSCDVTMEDEVRSAVDVACDGDGGLDIAVLSHGVGFLSPVIATDLAAWQMVLDCDLTGSFLVMKHAGRAMAASGGGVIVAVSSIAGVRTHRHMAPYCVSKAGLDMLVRVAADELGAAGVRVNSVRPGWVQTDLMDFVKDNAEVVQSYLDNMPVRRLGDVEDVAAGVRYLVGPEAGWVTGQCLGIDGGHALRSGPDYGPLARAIYGEVADGIVDGA